MYLDSEIIAFVFAFLLVVVAISFTIHVIFSNHKSKSERFLEADPFLDADGNHIYYERAIIEKKIYCLNNPMDSNKSVRTLKRLFYPIISILFKRKPLNF